MSWIPSWIKNFALFCIKLEAYDVVLGHNQAFGINNLAQTRGSDYQVV